MEDDNIENLDSVTPKMSNEASAQTEDLDYFIALSLASEEAEAHQPEDLLALSLAYEQTETQHRLIANMGRCTNTPYRGLSNIAEDLQDDGVQFAASDIESERSCFCLGIDDYSVRSEGVEVQLVDRSKQEEPPPLAGLQKPTSIQVPANFWQAEDNSTLEEQQSDQGNSGASDHSTGYFCIDEDEDEYYAEDDDYSYPFSGDDSNQELSEACNQEDSDSDRSGSSFVFVFQGIDLVENMTPEYIESCTSLSEIEEIHKKLIADGSKFYLVHVANQRILTLRQKDNHNEDAGDDDDFVVITSDNNSTELNTKTKKESSSTNTQKTTSASATSSTNTSASNKPTIYPDLTPNILRSVIVIYSREHPDDLGMPMKKLMKFFAIKKKTPPERRDHFQKLVNQQCLLETSDEIGRVLFLKESDEPCEDFKMKYEDAKKKYDDTVGEHDRYWLIVMKQIENCNSTRELQVIIDDLRKSNIDLPHHMTAATERMQTLSRSSIDNVKEVKKQYNNTVDFDDKKNVMVKIENIEEVNNNNGDWDAVIEATKAFDKSDQDSSIAVASKRMEMVEQEKDIDDGEKFYSENSYTDESGTSATTTSEDRRKRSEYRVQVEELVKIVLPDEPERVDAMMDQFKGREAELLSTLQTMEERSSNTRARLAVHKSKPQENVMEKIENCNSIRELRVIMNSGITLSHYMAAATVAAATERMRTLSMLSVEDIEEVKKKYDDANKKDNDTIAEHHRKSVMEQIENCNLDVEVKQFAMKQIENCNSIRQLRVVIDELRKSHNKAAAIDSIDDTDSVRAPTNIGSLTIEYIENCRNISKLFQIVNYIDTFERDGERFHERDGERLYDKFMYDSETSLPSRYQGLHDAVIKRLIALVFESRDLSGSHAFECYAEPASSDDANKLDQMLATSLSLEINKEPIADTNIYPSDFNFEPSPIEGFFTPCPPRLKISDDLGFSGFGDKRNPDPKPHTQRSARIHLEPNFYFYDDSIPELIHFSLLTYIEPNRERQALEYIEKCNFIPELRGIIHFWEEPENFGLGDSLIRSAKTRIQTILRTDPLAAVHPDYYAFDSEESNNWLVFDSDIQLTSDIQRLIYARNSDLEWQKGNRWLMDVVAKNYERDFNGGNGLHLFAGVIKQVKAEGRRFFRLCGHSKTNKRLIWVDDDHEDVRAELLYLFQCIHKKGISRWIQKH